MIVKNNWTFDHDDHSPFGSDEHIYLTEYHSLVITVFFFLVGLLGNSLILIGNGYILRHSYDGEKRTFENFLIEIACFDLIILLYHLFNSIIRYDAWKNSHVDAMTGLINLSTVSCKLLTYIIRICTLMSHWLIILLLLNRLFLIYTKFYRLTTIINAKYAFLALLFLLTLFNVLPIESMSYNEPVGLSSNLSSNAIMYDHCLMNAEMVDLQASIHSVAVQMSVFFYTGLGLIFPTIIIGGLSILIFRKGAQLWNDLHSHHSSTENISLQSHSPVVEYLRTYNASFTFGILFVCLSIPCKILRLIVLFASDHLEEASSSHILLKAHTQMQTVGHAFELSLYSYKCFILICTNHRFRSALKALFTIRRGHIILDQRRSTVESYYGPKHTHTRHSEEAVPFEGLYKHLQVGEFGTPRKISRTTGGRCSATGSYSHRSSFKTRSSVSSRRTKEDEISL